MTTMLWPMNHLSKLVTMACRSVCVFSFVFVFCQKVILGNVAAWIWQMYAGNWISSSCRLSGASAGVNDRCAIYIWLHIRLEYITIKALDTGGKKNHHWDGIPRMLWPALSSYSSEGGFLKSNSLSSNCLSRHVPPLFFLLLCMFCIPLYLSQLQFIQCTLVWLKNCSNGI